MANFKKWAQKTGFKPATSQPSTPPLAPKKAPEPASAGSVTLYTAAGQPVTLSPQQTVQPSTGQQRLVGTFRPNQQHPKQVRPPQTTEHAPECMIVKKDEYKGYTSLLRQLPDLVASGHVADTNPDRVDMLKAFGVPEGAAMSNWTATARAYNGATEASSNVDDQMRRRHQEDRMAARSGGNHNVTGTARGSSGKVF